MFRGDICPGYCFCFDFKSFQQLQHSIISLMPCRSRGLYARNKFYSYKYDSSPFYKIRESFSCLRNSKFRCICGKCTIRSRHCHFFRILRLEKHHFHVGNSGSCRNRLLFSISPYLEPVFKKCFLIF